MTVLPVYNKLIAPDSDVYFRRDQFRYLAGNVNVDEKVILLISKKDESRAERSEDSFYPIGLSGVVAEISNDGYAVVRAGGRVNVESVVINRDKSISLMTSRRNDIRDLPDEEAEEKLQQAGEAVKVLRVHPQLVIREMPESPGIPVKTFMLQKNHLIRLILLYLQSAREGNKKEI